MQQNSGCFGCCTKPTPIIAVDEPSKGLRIQGRAVNKPSISNDFWSSSTCDLDNSTVQSQRSISSISVSNHNLGSSTGSMSSNNEFVNHGKLQLICSSWLFMMLCGIDILLFSGLLLWQQRRLQWAGSGTSANQNQRRWESRLRCFLSSKHSLFWFKCSSFLQPPVKATLIRGSPAF